MKRLFLWFSRRMLESNGWVAQDGGRWSLPRRQGCALTTWEADAIRRMVEGFRE